MGGVNHKQPKSQESGYGLCGSLFIFVLPPLYLTGTICRLIWKRKYEAVPWPISITATVMSRHLSELPQAGGSFYLVQYEIFISSQIWTHISNSFLLDLGLMSENVRWVSEKVNMIVIGWGFSCRRRVGADWFREQCHGELIGTAVVHGLISLLSFMQ